MQRDIAALGGQSVCAGGPYATAARRQSFWLVGNQPQSCLVRYSPCPCNQSQAPLGAVVCASDAVLDHFENPCRTQRLAHGLI